MRIVIAGIHGVVTGGAESYLKALVPLLEARGHEVWYGYQVPGGPGPPVAREDISVNLGAAAAHALVELRPDVVLQNSLLSPTEEVRLVRSKAPVAFFAHAYSGLCISGTRRFSRPLPEVCSRTFGAGCWSHYFNRGCGGANPVTALKLFQANARRLEAMRAARAVVVASEHMRELVVHHGVATERVVKIPYFVPAPDGGVDSRHRLGLKRVTFVGRVTRLKGWPEMLEAFRLFRQAHDGWTLTVAGDGPDLSTLTSRVAQLGLPVTVHPWQDETGLDNLLRSSTVLILPSTWPEPFGIVGLEAARLGVPTVSFGTGGIRDWLSPGINGEIATQLTARALADALALAVATEVHYAALTQGALRLAAGYGPERHLEPLINLLESVSREARTSPERGSLS